MSISAEMSLNIAGQKEKAIEEILLPQVKSFCSPAIKGEITRGKVKWRGIKMIIQASYADGDVYWFEQRGERITQKLQFKYSIKGD